MYTYRFVSIYIFRYLRITSGIVNRIQACNNRSTSHSLVFFFAGTTLTPCPSASSTSVSTSSSASSTPPRLALRHCVTRFTVYHLSTVISIVSTLANERPDGCRPPALIATKSGHAESTRCDRRCHDRPLCFCRRFRCRHLA